MKNSSAILLLLFLILVFTITFSVPNELQNQIIKVPKIDSYGHFFTFFILTWFLNSVIKLPLMSTVLALVVYGALSELGQLYLGFRNGEFSDFIADTVGILTFVLIKWGYLVYGKNNPHES